MTNYREIARLKEQGLSQRRMAAACQCSRNTVAQVLLRLLETGLTWQDCQAKSNQELEQILFPAKTAVSNRKMPDYEYVHRELAKDGVTLSLLWDEYCSKCRCNNEIPLMYTQYCFYYRQFAMTNKATMHIHRKPGERIEVDWSGTKAKIVDRDTGEYIELPVFVGVLSSSQYAYAEAFASQNLESWITAHTNMFLHFGGVARILTPDNLKTGVEKIDWCEAKLNQTYQEMAEHYGTVIIPARVRRPKDKPSVEGSVGVVATWIIAALRNETFYSIFELNEGIKEKLKVLNEKPFQKRPGSRYVTFLDEEQAKLIPLPSTIFEMATWRIATVSFNYHIAIDKNFYSVPFQYIRQKVDVRLTRNIVEIFKDGNRLCSHQRCHGRTNQYSTMTEHMPEDHKKYIEWDSERFIRWANTIGEYTEATIKAILSGLKVKQQGYRSCMALLKLAEKHGESRLENACCKALSYTSRPSYQNIKTILLSHQDKLPAKPPQPSSCHSFTRGAEYYGGLE